MNITEFHGPSDIMLNYKSGYEKGQTLEESLAAAADKFAASLDSSPSVSTGWTVSSGWIQSRASGILAVLLSANSMTLADVHNFYSNNGLAGHTPSLSVNDIATVANNGELSLSDSWVWPSDWQSRWDRWAAGEIISVLPGGQAPAGPAPGKSVMSDILLPLLIMLGGY